MKFIETSVEATKSATVMLLVVGLILGASAHAQSEQKNEAKSAEIFVEQLGAPSFAARRDAFLKIWEIGELAIPALEPAVRSENAQVSESASILALLIKSNTLPGDASQAQELVRALQNRPDAAVLELCRQGYWKLAIEYTESNAAVKKAFNASYGNFIVQRIIHTASEQRQLEKAWPFVMEVCEADQLSWIAAQTGFMIPQPVFETKPELSAWQSYFAGDLDRALAAKLSVEDRLRMVVRGGHWDKLLIADFQELIIGAPKPLTFTQRAVEAVLVDFSGNPRKADELWEQLFKDNKATSKDEEQQIAVDELLKLNEDNNKAPLYQLLMALMISGHTDAVHAFLDQSASDEAFDFASLQSDFGRAFEKLGLKADLSNFDDWLEQTLPSPEGSDAKRLSPEKRQTFGRCSLLASNLIGLGFKTQGKQILERLAVVADHIRYEESNVWQRFLLRRVYQPEIRKIVLELGRTWFDSMSKPCRKTVLESLFDALGSASTDLMKKCPIEYLAEIHPEMQEDELRWLALDHLNRLDLEFFGKRARPIIREWLFASLETGDEARLASNNIERLGQLALDFGDIELAIDLFLTDSGNYNSHWIKAAQLLISQGQLETAREVLDAVPDFGSVPLANLKAKMLFLEGKYEEGRELERAKFLMPYDRNTVRTQSYASLMRLFSLDEEYELTAQFAEPALALTPLADPLSYSVIREAASAYKQLGRESEIADQYRALMIGCLIYNSEMARFYISQNSMSSLRYYAEQDRLETAIQMLESGKLEAGYRELQIAASNKPQDIDIVVRSFPVLEKLDKTLANELFKQFETSMNAQIATWPNDSTALNNLAWMYAKTDRNLDIAEQLSKRSVQVASSSATYLDTLAEIAFRKGEVDKAIDLMRQCVKLDPRDQNYRKNLLRFQKETKNGHSNE